MALAKVNKAPVVYRGVGRPKKWTSPEQLQTQINEYFASLIDEHHERVLVNDSERGPLYEWKPVLDRHGNVEVIYKENPSVTGLALFLGTNREALMRYTKDSEYHDTIKQAKAAIEKFYENDRTEAPVLTIFKLKNMNTKSWADTQEVKSTQTITQTNIVDPVDLDDRINSIVQSKIDALQ